MGDGVERKRGGRDREREVISRVEVLVKHRLMCPLETRREES
jgi:hypothetical protein